MRIRLALVIALGTLGFALNAVALGTDRVKLACPADSAVDHPCRAVYFVGADNKRRAFPNAAVYFSWYPNFSGVTTIDTATMAALPLGPNVTFRPGARLVKIPSDPKVYAVDASATLRWVTSEQAARAMFGVDWNKKIDDLIEAFVADYRFGTPIASSTDFDAGARRASASSIDTDNATYTVQKVTTSGGIFDATVVTLDRARFRMKTLVAATSDCGDGCATKPLADYAHDAGAAFGIHGTYFCPPDYVACGGKTSSFLWPVFDSASQQMRNANAIQYHQGPVLASAQNGQLVLYHRASNFGSADTFLTREHSLLDAAIANYPSLIENSIRVVDGDPMLDDGQRTTKATRAGIGFNDEKFILVVAKNATVLDLADIMLALGAKNAMNLDGGGTTALFYGGAYKIGPGRLLPNAIVFVRK